MADAILKLAKDDKLRKKIAIEGYKNFEKNYSPKQYINRLERIYYKTLKLKE
jgi:glycosyltransferase involved in cell wall biosynthesis